MCSNYKAVTRLDHLMTFFGVPPRDFRAPPPEWAEDIWPLYLAPFVRLAADGSGQRVAVAGQFGLVPNVAKELAWGRKTYNSRSETVDKLISFRDAWRKGQRCIIPVQEIYEPCYESGKAVRWCIEKPGNVPFGIAGIWNEHPYLKRKSGAPMLSFAMLTVNADGHPVFIRMHRPEDEKRMVVILQPDDYDVWLSCPVADAPNFFRQWRQPLNAYAKPLPPRKPKPKEGGDGLLI